MKIWAALFSLLMALAGPHSSLPAAFAQTLPDPQIRVDIDEEKIAARIMASIEIPAPRDVVWKVMTDCGKALKIIQNLVSCRVLEGAVQANRDIREHVFAPGFLLPNTRNVFQSTYEPGRRIRFHRLSGDLKVSEGEWLLEPLAGQTSTRVIYKARIALAAPVPGAVIRSYLRWTFPDVLRALRTESMEAARHGR